MSGIPPKKSIDDLVATFIGEAASNPDQAPLIYRRAATMFHGLSADPRNVHVAGQLRAIADNFSSVMVGGRHRHISAQDIARPATSDDFYDQMEDTADAYAEVGNQEMDVIARRREIHDERSNEVPRVSIAPATFNRDTPLGRAVKLKYAPTAEEKLENVVESETLAFWQGDKQEAQAMTVDIAPLSVPQITPRLIAERLEVQRPYATIVYGSDGNRTIVKVDIGFGVRLTVVGNYISVLVSMAPPPTGFRSAVMTIGASIGAFAAPSLAPVIFTEYVDELGEGEASGFIQRPVKASQILPLQTNILSGTIQIACYGIGGGIPLYGYTFPAGQLNTSPVPLTSDVGYITVLNNTGDIANIRVPFQLSM